MIKLIYIFLVLVSLLSCRESNQRKEIIKCVVVSCDELIPVSIHDDINRPLGYKMETSCGMSFKSKIKYETCDIIEVTKITILRQLKLKDLIKQKAADAFDFFDISYVTKNPGLWNHTNVRRDKVDMFPQQELIDMLLSL